MHTDHTPLAGGIHCETSTLRVLFAGAGIDLSEPMLFGLGSGLSFVYWDSRRQPAPFIGGRVKPFEIARSVAVRCGVDLDVHETASPRLAWEKVRGALDQGLAVGLQLDSYYLEYFTSRVHFAGHFAAIIGYDDRSAHLVDTAQQGGRVSTSLDSFAQARSARGPMSARNRSFTVHAGPPRDLSSSIVDAVTATAVAYLNPPIANVGGRGVRTAARKLPAWLDRVADPSTDLPLIASLMERGGTGGGLFRTLYRDFLVEARDVVAPDLAEAEAAAWGESIDLFAESAVLWTRAAELIEAAGREREPRLLAEASTVLNTIADRETTAMERLRTLEHRSVRPRL
ncbi:BtrH N-terminal domain-containing protein [Microbacterium sp. ZW T5_56]|uniref:BtrH N-terminal domain-containing protein n=1 Tax=Microbacterium sp. ZW T5_56 TaxID=3378081 RepID=UPI00385369E5